MRETIARHIVALFVDFPDESRELANVSTIDLGIDKYEGEDRRDLARSTTEDHNVPLICLALVRVFKYHQEVAFTGRERKRLPCHPCASVEARRRIQDLDSIQSCDHTD